MTRTRDDEQVEVELLDDGRGGHTVEVGGTGGDGRRRRPELVLVLLAVAVLVALLVIGGGDGGGPTAGPSTTTTAERRTTTTRRTVATRPPSTTSTVYPQHVAGTGPVLGEPTGGTVIGVLEGNGVISVIDLDTGDRCSARPSRDGAWLPWPGVIEVREVLVQAGNSSLLVDRDCSVRPFDVQIFDRWVVALTSETVWLGSGDAQQHVVEVRLDDGRETGRSIDLPPNTGATIVPVDEHLVVAVSGEMTLVEQDGARRDLGPGTPIGGRHGVLLYLSCPRLECALAVRELATGRETRVGIVPAPWETPAFSRDGRYVRVSIGGDDGEVTAAVLDLEDLTLVLADVSLQQSVFSADGRWLIGHRAGGLVAVAVDDDVERELDVDVSEIQNLVLLRS